jgi:hypothetical protein
MHVCMCMHTIHQNKVLRLRLRLYGYGDESGIIRHAYLKTHVILVCVQAQKCHEMRNGSELE